MLLHPDQVGFIEELFTMVSDFEIRDPELAKLQSQGIREALLKNDIHPLDLWRAWARRHLDFKVERFAGPEATATVRDSNYFETGFGTGFVAALLSIRLVIEDSAAANEFAGGWENKWQKAKETHPELRSLLKKEPPSERSSNKET